MTCIVTRKRDVFNGDLGVIEKISRIVSVRLTPLHRAKGNAPKMVHRYPTKITAGGCLVKHH